MRKLTTRLLALLLVLIQLAAFAACKTSDTKPSAESPGIAAKPSESTDAPTAGTSDPDRVLYVAVSQDSGTLNPADISGYGGFLSVARTYMETLYDYKTDGTRFWVLATGIDTISPIHYTLHIREGVTFNNGNPLTAEDVMFTMERCLDDPLSFLNVQAIDFEKTKVIDNYTIDLWYTQYDASQELGMGCLGISDKESYGDPNMATKPIGTGPYVVTDYVVNSHVIVEARENYWGDPPAIKKIHFKTLNEDSQRVNALETGDVDMAMIPLSDAAFVEELGNYNIDYSNIGNYYVSLFNMSPQSRIPSKDARHAICYAIDRQAIANLVFLGRSKILDWPCSSSLIDYDPSFSNIHDTYSTGYNPDKAKQLAEESGLVNQKLRIITNGSGVFISIAEIIQNGLGAIGVDSEIVNYDQATYFSVLYDTSMYDIGILPPIAPSMMCADILASYPNFITLGWEGPLREEFLTNAKKALATVDIRDRAKVMLEALKIFTEETPWFGLCDGAAATVASKDLDGVFYTMSGAALYYYYSFK
jgi:peptide/nickel transport system substrate-binding protein